MDFCKIRFKKGYKPSISSGIEWKYSRIVIVYQNRMFIWNWSK